MLNDDTTGMKQKTIDAYTQFADSQSPTDNTNMSLGFVNEEGFIDAPAPSSSSSNDNSSSTTGSVAEVPGASGPPGRDYSVNDNNDNDNDYADQYSGPYNKGGLASKKSKKGYNKGGYSTKKKMNTGGLVKKKKKK